MKYYSLLKKLSYRSNHHTHKVSAIITRGNRVIGKGFNLIKTHTYSPHPYHHIHAEYLAYLNTDGDIKGCTVYIFRQYKNGNLALAKPCDSCYKFLVSKGVKNIVYSFQNTFVEEKVA